METGDIHELLRRRWSPRAFSPQPVPPDTLERLFEAARWAPSSNNEQPWSFVVATSDQLDDFARLRDCLNEKNALWAGRAPVLMLSVARRHFNRNGQENRHALHDVGQAVANLTFQATAEGLFVHQMAGFSVEKARETLGLPNGQEPVAMIALGFPGDPAALPDDLRARELASADPPARVGVRFPGALGRSGLKQVQGLFHEAPWDDDQAAPVRKAFVLLRQFLQGRRHRLLGALDFFGNVGEALGDFEGLPGVVAAIRQIAGRAPQVQRDLLGLGQDHFRVRDRRAQQEFSGEAAGHGDGDGVVFQKEVRRPHAEQLAGGDAANLGPGLVGREAPDHAFVGVQRFAPEQQFDIADQIAPAFGGDVPLAVAPDVDHFEAPAQDAEQGQIVRPFPLLENHFLLVAGPDDAAAHGPRQRLRPAP